METSGLKKPKKGLIIGVILVVIAVVGIANASPSPTPTDSAKPAAVDVPTTSETAITTTAPVETPEPAPVDAPAPTPAPVAAPKPKTCAAGYYLNVDDNCISSPVAAPSTPAGATAECRDGTYSFSQHRSGTCSHHGGVARWL